MSKFERVLAALLLFSVSAMAAAATPPSDAAIKQLLVVMETPKQIEGLISQLAGMMMKGALQALQEQAVTPAQRAAVDRFRSKTVTVLRDEMGWDKLQPLYVQLYRESLTQEEVAGLLAFYKTPAGQAALTKVPAVSAKAMGTIQGRMEPVMQKLQVAHQQAVEEMKAQPAK